MVLRDPSAWYNLTFLPVGTVLWFERGVNRLLNIVEPDGHHFRHCSPAAPVAPVSGHSGRARRGDPSPRPRLRQRGQPRLCDPFGVAGRLTPHVFV